MFATDVEAELDSMYISTVLISKCSTAVVNSASIVLQS